MSSYDCCFLICIAISQEACKVVWYSHLLRNFPQFVVIHTVKGSISEAEVDVFLEFSCFFYDTADVGSLISGSSSFSKSILYIWKFMYCWSLALQDFEHYLGSTWNEYNCAVVWAFFGISLFWDWNKNGSFPVLWPQIFLYMKCSTSMASSFNIWSSSVHSEFHHLH